MKCLYGPEIGAWIEKKTGGSYDPRAVSIGLVRDSGEVVAGILYESWNGASAMCHMAASGRMTREFLWANADYAFRQVGLNKLIAPVAMWNFRMMKMAAAMGFRCEAVIRNGHPQGDLALMTLAKEDCRFLGERYGKAKTARSA